MKHTLKVKSAVLIKETKTRILYKNLKGNIMRYFFLNHKNRSKRKVFFIFREMCK